MPFPAPDPFTHIFWLIDANGFMLSMESFAGEPGGQPTISLSDGTLDQNSVLWSEDEKKLTFNRGLDTGEVQTWTGFLFDATNLPVAITGNPPGTAGQISFVFALAGPIKSAGGFEGRSEFGWFALGGPGV